MSTSSQKLAGSSAVAVYVVAKHSIVLSAITS